MTVHHWPRREWFSAFAGGLVSGHNGEIDDVPRELMLAGASQHHDVPVPQLKCSAGDDEWSPVGFLRGSDDISKISWVRTKNPGFGQTIRPDLVMLSSSIPGFSTAA